MTAQKLYGTLKFFDELDSRLSLQRSLEAVRDTLNNLVNAPANPTHQASLASNLSAFKSAAEKMKEALTPALVGILNEMGGSELFDSV